MNRWASARLAIAGLLIALAGSLTGCKHHDDGWCDYYHGLAANYTQSQGYVPSSVQAQIDNYC